MSSAPDRVALETTSRRLLSRARNWSKADVYAIDHRGREIVVKDFMARPWLARQTLGRWFAGREARLYRALAGVPGIPAYVGRPDPFSFAVERVDGERLREAGRRRADPEVFAAISRTLDAVHERGIALADLHHRNVLLTSRGPFLVDLAMGVERRRGLHVVSRLLFRVFRRLDRVALARMKRRYLGVLSPSEATLLERGAGVHRVGRALKGLLNLARLGRHAEKPR